MYLEGMKPPIQRGAVEMGTLRYCRIDRLCASIHVCKYGFIDWLSYGTCRLRPMLPRLSPFLLHYFFFFVTQCRVKSFMGIFCREVFKLSRHPGKPGFFRMHNAAFHRREQTCRPQMYNTYSNRADRPSFVPTRVESAREKKNSIFPLCLFNH